MDKETFTQAFPDVSHETIHRLELYRDLLTEWNERFNLVAASTIPHIWVRHFLDSAQLMAHIPEKAETLADMGSGAGFPGLVLAIMAKGRGSKIKTFLLESTGKKADFLKNVAEKLDLDVVVRNERIEAIKDLKADIITARALKALPELLKYANRLIKKDSICLFLKGRTLAEELTEAKKYWTFQARISSSSSDDSGQVLRLSQLQYKTRR